MTPRQHAAALAAIKDLEAAMRDAYRNGEITAPDADEFLRMLNALTLFITLKPFKGPQS